MWPERVTVLLEIDEKDEGLFGISVKDAVAGEVGFRVERGCGICFVQDFEEWVDVEASESACRR